METKELERLLKTKRDSHYRIKADGSPLFIKDVDMSKKVVTGFYNMCNYLDSDGDICMPGFNKKSIKDRGPKSTAPGKIKHCLFHDLTQLPGKVEILEEREYTHKGVTTVGSYFETKMSDTTLGRDTLLNYQSEIYDNHSFGFQYLQLEAVERDAKGWDKIMQSLINPEAAEGKGHVFIVKEVNQFEVSTVPFGANQLTPYLGCKGMDKDVAAMAVMQKIAKLEHTVKNGNQSDEMMYSFECQILQLKQMLAEIAEMIPVTQKEKKKEEKKGIDLNRLAKNFQYS